MNEQLFELFGNSDLILDDKVNVDKIRKLSATKIADLSHQAALLTLSQELPRERSAFVHSASRSLSGDRWPCSALKCRQQSADQLAQFAAFYSDRVYFRNLLSDYSTHIGGINSWPIDIVRRNFAYDLAIIRYLRPMIEQGVLMPITTPNYCLHCLTTKTFGPDADARFRSVFKELPKRYNSEITVTLSRENGLYVFTVGGPELLIAHGGLVSSRPDLPKALEKKPRLIAKLEAGETVTLSHTVVRKIGLDSALAGEIRQGITFELAAALSLGTFFLTDRDLDIELLRKLSNDPSIEQQNQFMQKHLTCLVPFIDAVSPVDVMRLRDKEGPAFTLFRSALAKALDEQKARGESLTDRDAKAIYGDILQPQLARLDNKVNAARRTLFRRTAADIIAWTAAISAGHYLGFVPSGIVAAATALGLTKLLADAAQEFLTKRDVQEEIRQDELYFLWKVRELSRQ